MAQPEFATRSAEALLDPMISAHIAGDAAARALSMARSSLESSNASIAFEVLCVSDRDALAESASSAFGTEAGMALKSDPVAYGMLPQRSSCSLSAWRFSDDSFVLCSRTVDGSLAAFGKALLACTPLLALIGPDKDRSIARAMRLANQPESAIPLSKQELSNLLLSMTDGDDWKRGTRILAREGSAQLPPSLLLARLDAAEPHAGLDQIIADVLAAKKKDKPS